MRAVLGGVRGWGSQGVPKFIYTYSKFIFHSHFIFYLQFIFHIHLHVYRPVRRWPIK